MSICLITCDVNLDYLVEVVSARSLHCKVTIFTLKRSQYVGRRYFEML